MAYLHRLIFCMWLALHETVTSEERIFYPLQFKQYFTQGNLEKESLFGYSVTYNKRIDKLIIGAPKAHFTGAIYSCETKLFGKPCERLSVPKSDLAVEKHGFWLGATVNAGNDFFMTCAPRFAQGNGNFTGTYGKCYSFDVDKSLSTSKHRMSSVSDKMAYHFSAYPDAEDLYKRRGYISPEYLMDSLGWSSYVNMETSSIVVGGPAMSIGRAIMYADRNASPYSIGVDNKHLKSIHKEIAFNFGYSIASGKFNGEDEIYAISTPFGAMGLGRVIFYTLLEWLNSDKLEWMNLDIEDEEVGSIFGAALCTMTLGDEVALLVGAPASTAASAVGYHGPVYDVGAVYLYEYLVDENKFQLKRNLTGFKSGGYFGNTIVSLGDLNNDKVDEIAISAPYEDENRGAVYIYSGADLLSDKDVVRPKQRVVAEGGPNTYFGWSLHALDDTDNNGCKELAIGAPGDNSVMLLRCIPNVHVEFQAPFPNLDSQSKALLTSDTSFIYRICLNVIYPHDRLPSPINTEVLVMIKLNDHPNVRIYLASNGGTSFKYQLNQRKPQYCSDITVLLPKDGDYDYPIEFTLIAAPVQNPLAMKQFNPNLVLLDGTLTDKTTIPINQFPGSKLNYNITTTIKNDYVIGSTDNENLTMVMWNDGTGKAFGACVEVRVRGVPVSVWPRICKLSGEILTCTPETALAKGQTWNTTVTLNMAKMTNADTTIDIYAKVLTHCKQPTREPYNNVIKLTTDYNILVRGISSPSTNLNVTRKILKATGKQIEHIYSILNQGMTTWKDQIWNVTLPANINCGVYIGGKVCKVNGTQGECKIDRLPRTMVTTIRIIMHVRPDTPIIGQILKGQASVLTSINLIVKTGTHYVQRASIKTVISLWEDPKVPLWIVIVAAIIGLIILLIFAYILYKCGFLKREKKSELEKMKKEVKRQSVRKSAMLRQSTIEVMTNDKQKLVEVPEESEHLDDGDDLTLTEEDQARAAFTAELNKALGKDTTTTTKASVH